MSKYLINAINNVQFMISQYLTNEAKKFFNLKSLILNLWGH